MSDFIRAKDGQVSFRFPQDDNKVQDAWDLLHSIASALKISHSRVAQRIVVNWLLEHVDDSVGSYKDLSRWTTSNRPSRRIPISTGVMMVPCEDDEQRQEQPPKPVNEKWARELAEQEAFRQSILASVEGAGGGVRPLDRRRTLNSDQYAMRLHGEVTTLLNRASQLLTDDDELGSLVREQMKIKLREAVIKLRKIEASL